MAEIGICFVIKRMRLITSFRYISALTKLRYINSCFVIKRMRLNSSKYVIQFSIKLSKIKFILFETILTYLFYF
jgi:hypothetical protein